MKKLLLSLIIIGLSRISAQNTWTQKNDFPGSTRILATSFTIGDRAYMSPGTSENEIDFWEYNPANDVWTQKSDFPGGKRDAAVSFSIEGFGYLGTGYYNG